MEWHWTNLVLERMFNFIWLHPGWTIFIIACIFGSTTVSTKR